MPVYLKIGVFLALLACPQLCLAQSMVNDMVNVAGRQRLLAQRMAAQACYITAGIEAAQMQAALKHDMILFEDSLENLLNGNEALGWPATQNPPVRSTLMRSKKMWEGMQRMLALPSEGTAMRPASLGALSSAADELTEVSNLATSALEQSMVMASANPLTTQLVNIAGRQRMLLKRMEKGLCMLSLDLKSEMHRSQLIETLDEFDRASFALAFTHPDFRIPAPPTPEIELSTELLFSNWVRIMPEFEWAATQEGTIADEILIEVAQTGAWMLENQNELVNLYARLD
ncbi:hypothetical protein AQS8620_02737 [Aquimixticola soesokkakensis]|uniref:NarX-like N-terminal domain-containing protein n=1 Tax=Aquimixticola soesokkakensis TaxID=1519096 RepID=A0A1Y5TCH0_9RHOB|nr:type IV pili methyl-accepting chemotaxis transducer N-terminal domain-containing protein [Aquimixticola soesokkakensis]SLN60599.1 hypothetical protein AQS8620_02737 [Aquimixticola soesokkakensis]